jgi:hypothetical protein
MRYVTTQLRSFLAESKELSAHFSLLAALVFEENMTKCSSPTGFFRNFLDATSRWMKETSSSFLCVLRMVLNVLLACTLSIVTKTEADGLADKGRALEQHGNDGRNHHRYFDVFFDSPESPNCVANVFSDDFLKDPVAVIVISVNIGAYAFCYTLQYFLDDNGLRRNVPCISVHLLSVHMALILVTFVCFIHIFINGFRVEKILSRAAASSLRAAQAFSNDCSSNPKELKASMSTAGLSPPSEAHKVVADKSGYVNRFQLRSVLCLAEELDVRIRCCYQIGEYVNEGTILCYIWDTKTNPEYKDLSLEQRVVDLVEDVEADNSRPWEDQVERMLGIVADKGIHMTALRSRGLDVTLGIQQLCDIAVRALSDAV